MLTNKLFLDIAPCDLQQAFFLLGRKMFFHLLVQARQILAHNRRWVLGDHLLERLLVVRQMEAHILGSLGLDQAFDAIKEVLLS